MRILYFFMAALLVLSACKRDNPPYEDISGTRWIGTNIARGELADVQIGPKGTFAASLSFYLDPVDYETRGAVIDTSGHLLYTMQGTYTENFSTKDDGTSVKGYLWTLSFTRTDGANSSGTMYYDNKRMFLSFDEGYYPMYQEK